MMSRRLAVCLLLITTATSSPGCALWPPFWVRDEFDPPPRVFSTDVSREEILEHLNNERGRLIGWRSDEVRITARGNGIIAPKLSAKLSVETPRNLRMMASSLRGDEVDFGSNDERFWFWMRASRQMLTGSHAGLARQPSMPLPFPPSWLMEALGVIPIDPNGIQMLRPDDNPDQVQLISAEYLQGQRMQRIMVVDLNLGQITEHALYDASENLVASASMSDFQPSPAGVTLPHKIELHWPSEGTELSLKIGTIEVNPQMPDSMWQPQRYPGHEVVDLDNVTLRRQ